MKLEEEVAMTIEQKQSLSERLDQVFKKLHHLPGFHVMMTMFTEAFNILQETSDQIPQENLQLKKDIDYETSEKVGSFIEALEEVFDLVAKEERKKKYEMRTFRFNLDMILEHTKKIESVMNKIFYLQYILKVYPDYQRLMNRKLDETLVKKHLDTPGFMNEILKEVINLYLAVFSESKYYPTIFTEKPFKERILEEINYLQTLSSEDNLDQTLDQINNPPGTRKTFKTNEKTDEDKTAENPKDDLYTTKELCSMFSVSDQTIRNWQAKGIITRLKIGRKIYFRKAEIEKLLESKKY